MLRASLPGLLPKVGFTIFNSTNLIVLLHIDLPLLRMALLYVGISILIIKFTSMYRLVLLL